MKEEIATNIHKLMNFDKMAALNVNTVNNIPWQKGETDLSNRHQIEKNILNTGNGT